MNILIKIIFAFIYTFSFSLVGYGQKYETNYTIDSIPKISKFYILNSDEKSMDSLNKTQEKKDKFGRDKIVFSNNRSRVFLDKFWDDVEDSLVNIANPKFISLYCTCDTKNDTISIKTGWDYYGTFIFKIDLFNNVFDSKIYLNEELIEMQYQKLILDNQPNFKKSEQLTGLLTFKTKKQKITNEFNTESKQRHYEGNIYFTCKTDQFINR